MFITLPSSLNHAQSHDCTLANSCLHRVMSLWEKKVYLPVTSSVSRVTCASSSFSPLAGVEGMGIFLADEGLDVGVEDLGVVAADLEAPAAGQRGFFYCGGKTCWVVSGDLGPEESLPAVGELAAWCDFFGRLKICSPGSGGGIASWPCLAATGSYSLPS